jgi:hypothetical protein
MFYKISVEGDALGLQFATENGDEINDGCCQRSRMGQTGELV